MISSRYLSQIHDDFSLRIDVKFISNQNEYFHNDNFIQYKYLESPRKIFEKPDHNKVLDEDDFKYCEITDISEDGEINPYLIEPEEVEIGSEEERILSKIKKGDIISANNGNILLSSVRPNLKKYIYIDKDKEQVYFTKAMILLNPIKNNKILYYLLRSDSYTHQINAISRLGKSYPTVNKEDILRHLRIPLKMFVDGADSLIEEIEILEHKITKLRSQKKSYQEIANTVLFKYFPYNVGEYETENAQNIYFKSLSNLSENFGIRNSFRANKLYKLQSILYQNVEHSELLGKYIKATRNGWSPSCHVFEGTPVLGIDSIQDGRIRFGNLKYTDESRIDIEKFFVYKGDFFISRGNTVDLVGLAGIVDVEPEENIIYPDLMIKIDFNGDDLYPPYLATLFNSVYGRTYVKYISKGKNQTMVKVSSDDIKNFIIPVPTIEIQKEIVNEIEAEMNKQRKTEQQIEQLRREIEEVVINSLTH